MFDHVRSAQPILAAVPDAMRLRIRRRGIDMSRGTDMSRDTMRYVIEAGFNIERIGSAFLDIILAIEASRSSASTEHSRARTSPA